MIELGEAVTADTETRQAMKDAIVDVVGGSGAVVVDVRFVEDGQGGVVSIVVGVVCDNDGAAAVVVDTVEQRLKGDDCAAGVLCKATDVFVQGTDSSPSLASPGWQCAFACVLCSVAAMFSW